MGLPPKSKSRMTDLVLKPMVTSGSPILRNPQKEVSKKKKKKTDPTRGIIGSTSKPPISHVVNAPGAAGPDDASHPYSPLGQSAWPCGRPRRPSAGPPPGPAGCEGWRHRPSARPRGWDTCTPSELFLGRKHQKMTGSING